MAQSKEAATQQLGSIGEDTKKVGVSGTAEQQSDNVAHALAGAGGGLLSMALTYEAQSQSQLLPRLSTAALTIDAFSSL